MLNLEKVKEELKLKNIQIINDRAEIYAKKEREKFDIIPKKQKSLYITKKSYRMLMFLKRELYISRGFVMQIAIEQYYNYLCSDEYLTLLINKRNEVLKENSVCNQ